MINSELLHGKSLLFIVAIVIATYFVFRRFNSDHLQLETESQGE